MQELEQMGFEAAIKRLEEIVGLIDKSETPIESAIELYKEAAQLIKLCTNTIEQAELQVKVLLDGETSAEEENK